MLEVLDEFDRNIAKALAKEFPEWADFAKIKESNGEHALVFSIEPPSHNVKYPLCIDTFGGEVTVSFEYYHAHFNEFSDGTTQDALSLIRKVVSGSYAIVSFGRDDEWCGSEMLNEENLPTDNDEYPYANRIHIRSWTGILDNDICCSSHG